MTMTTTKIVIAFALALAGLATACGKSDTAQNAPTGKAPADNPPADKVPTENTPADRASAPAADRVSISVTEKGFEPENVSVPSGKPVTLVFTRTTDSTCAREVVIPLDGQKIEKKLPLNEAVAVEVTFPKAGQITYACGMDMIKGVVTVQ